MPKILIPTPLRQFADKKDAVEVAGATVGEALAALTTAHPPRRTHHDDDDDSTKRERTASEKATQGQLPLNPPRVRLFVCCCG